MAYTPSTSFIFESASYTPSTTFAIEATRRIVGGTKITLVSNSITIPSPLYTPSTTFTFTGDAYTPSTTFTMGVAATPSITGNVTISLTPDGSPHYWATHSITGAGSISLTPSSTMLWTEFVYSIVGDSSISLTPASTMYKGITHSITGASSISLTPAATLYTNNRYILAGSSSISLTPAATLYTNNRYTILGSSNISFTPAATFRKSSLFSILGDSSITVTPASTMRTKYIILGDSLISLTPNATFAKTITVTQTESIIGADVLTSLANNSAIAEETIEILDVILTSSSFDNSISEIFSTYDLVKIALNGSVLDSIIIADVISESIKQIERIVERLYYSSSLVTTSKYIKAVTESLGIIDSINHGILKEIVESIVIGLVSSDQHKAKETFIENISLIESQSEIYLAFNTLTDNISFTSVLSSLLEGTNTLTDEIIISLPGITSKDEYNTYLLSPETMTVSTYSNYNFDNSTKFNDKYLFSNSTGLYQYGGSTDNGDAIRAMIQTAALDFGTSNKKQVPNIYIGVANSDAVIIKVSVDDIGIFYYQLNKFTDDLKTQRIPIGKGLLGRYFQFEIVSDATQFDLESLEFVPLEVKRKI